MWSFIGFNVLFAGVSFGILRLIANKTGTSVVGQVCKVFGVITVIALWGGGGYWKNI